MDDKLFDELAEIVTDKTPPDDPNIPYIALTEAITISAIRILIEHNKVSLNQVRVAFSVARLRAESLLLESPDKEQSS
jgi:hypothetical protein